MNDRLRKVMEIKYRAEIEDAKYKIKSCKDEANMMDNNGGTQDEELRMFFIFSSSLKKTGIALRSLISFVFSLLLVVQ